MIRMRQNGPDNGKINNAPSNGENHRHHRHSRPKKNSEPRQNRPTFLPHGLSSESFTHPQILQQTPPMPVYAGRGLNPRPERSTPAKAEQQSPKNN